MKKILEFGKKISIFQWINIVLFLAITLIITPTYETNDDQAMVYMAMGVFGKREYQLVFINVLIGKILVFLFTLFPKLNWYVVLYEALVFTAITMSINMFEKKSRKKFATWTIMIIIYYFAVNYYYYVQFSKSAGILPAIGLLYSVYLTECQERKWYKYILPALLIIAGTCFRFEVIYMIGFIFIPILLYVFWKAEKKQKLYFAVYGALVLTLTFGIRFVDRTLYQSDEDWAYYLDFNEKRASLTDYGYPDYQSDVEKFNEIGISKVDYDNFQTWDYGDRDIFTTEILANLIEIRDSKTSVGEWDNFGKVFLPKFFLYNFVGIMFIAIAYMLAYGEIKRKYIGYISIVSFLIAEWILVLRGRFLVYRIDISAALALALICCYLAAEYRDDIDIKKEHYMFIAVTCVLALFGSREVFTSIGNRMVTENDYEARQLISEDKDSIYMLGTLVGAGVLNADIWEGIDEGTFSNCFRLGGWFIESPISIAQMENRGIENLYEAMVTRDDVYIIDNAYYEYKCAYLRENYDANAELVLAKNINGRLIWQIVTEDKYVDLAEYQSGAECLEYETTVKSTETGICVEGLIYEPNTDSYKQKVYVVLVDETADLQKVYYATQIVNEVSSDKMNGRYAGFTAEIEGAYTGEEKVYILVENEKDQYYVECN